MLKMSLLASAFVGSFFLATAAVTQGETLIDPNNPPPLAANCTYSFAEMLSELAEPYNLKPMWAGNTESIENIQATTLFSNANATQWVIVQTWPSKSCIVAVGTTHGLVNIR